MQPFILQVNSIPTLEYDNQHYFKLNTLKQNVFNY